MNKKNYQLITSQDQTFFQVISECYKQKFIIYELFKRDIKISYGYSYFGPLYFILLPIIQTFVFNFLLININSNLDSPSSFINIMCGMILWNFFATSAIKCSMTFISNTKTIKKVYYSRLIFFINPILMGLLNFFVQFIIFYFFLIYFKAQGVSIDLISWKLLLIPFVLIYVIIFSLGIGFIVSALSLKTRDVIYLLNFFFQMYLFLTPVLYPITVLKEGYLLAFNYFNPATIFVDLFKYIFFGGPLIPKIFILVNLVVISIFFLIGLKRFIKSIKILDDNL